MADIPVNKLKEFEDKMLEVKKELLNNFLFIYQNNKLYLLK